MSGIKRKFKIIRINQNKLGSKIKVAKKYKLRCQRKLQFTSCKNIKELLPTQQMNIVNFANFKIILEVKIINYSKSKIK